jgi:hypothetical protein
VHGSLDNAVGDGSGACTDRPSRRGVLVFIQPLQQQGVRVIPRLETSQLIRSSTSSGTSILTIVAEIVATV